MTDPISTHAQMMEAAAKAILSFAKARGWHPGAAPGLVAAIRALMEKPE